jgi:hypothetical protein
MHLTSESVGQRVAYRGPSERGLPFDEHYRVVRVYLPNSELPTGRTMICQTALLDDGAGQRVLVPSSVLAPVYEDCWCDACCVNGH